MRPSHYSDTSTSIQSSAIPVDGELEAAFARLETAVRDGDTAFVRAALESGISPDLKTRRGDPLLTLASYSGQVEVTRLLLERGVNPEATNARGHTALAGAAFQGDLAMIRLLIEGGARPDGPCADGKTPRMFAEAFGRSEAALLLESLGG